ncbi:MAG: toxin-antitoxin system HicB family antitoxin [Hydrogenibacillus sp.]|nr:toxin-antitoxin system HicB family antitoxin [Hydrogenibacillus sp.]
MAKKKQFPLRLDPDLYKAIEQWANDEFRSVNGQIEYLLKQCLIKAGRWKAGQPLEGGKDVDA